MRKFKKKHYLCRVLLYKNPTAMKKYIYILILVLSVSMFGSCQKKKNINLTEVAAQANQQCPIIFDNGILCIKIVYEEPYFTYYYSVDDDAWDMDQFTNENCAKDFRKSLLETTDPQTKSFVKAIKQGGAKVRYVYVGIITGTSRTVEFEL